MTEEEKELFKPIYGREPPVSDAVFTEIMEHALESTLQLIDHQEPTYHIRKEPIQEGELLYDRKGLIVAIKRKGQLLAVLRGEE